MRYAWSCDLTSHGHYADKSTKVYGQSSYHMYAFKIPAQILVVARQAELLQPAHVNISDMTSRCMW